jgi:N-acetylneuraminate synthase/N,N'-diacetyllegionaminate synthase
MHFPMNIKLAKRTIGNNSPCYIIAEAGVNHNGDLSKALALVDIAAEAQVDAIKFQTYKTEELVDTLAPMAPYQKKNTCLEQTQYELLKALELTHDNYIELQRYCQSLGITFISTPFDIPSVDFLEKINIPFYKIPSGELTNHPFLQYIACKDKSIIMSTGMADLTEIELAVKAILSTGNKKIILLHCVSSYPADPKDVNLKSIQQLSSYFNLPVGFSDHTLGINVALAAVALGACVIEKHFTLDKTLPGPDHQASLEPDALKALVKGIREIEVAMGNSNKKPSISEIKIAKLVRKSIITKVDIKKETIITEEMLSAKRPGTGISPSEICKVINKAANIDIEKGTFLSWEMFN